LIHFEALCLFDEEGWVRLDLFADLFDVPVSVAAEVGEVLAELGLVARQRFGVRDPAPWMWLRPPGGLVFDSCRPRLAPPRVSQLDHFVQLQRARVLLKRTAPTCVWVSRPAR